MTGTQLHNQVIKLEKDHITQQVKFNKHLIEVRAKFDKAKDLFDKKTKEYEETNQKSYQDIMNFIDLQLQQLSPKEQEVYRIKMLEKAKADALKNVSYEFENKKRELKQAKEGKKALSKKITNLEKEVKTFKANRNKEIIKHFNETIRQVKRNT